MAESFGGRDTDVRRRQEIKRLLWQLNFVLCPGSMFSNLANPVQVPSIMFILRERLRDRKDVSCVCGSMASAYGYVLQMFLLVSVCHVTVGMCRNKREITSVV